MNLMPGIREDWSDSCGFVFLFFWVRPTGLIHSRCAAKIVRLMPSVFSWRPVLAGLVWIAAAATAHAAPASAPAASASSAPASRPALPHPAKVNVKETLIYHIPDDTKVGIALASPDGRHIACIENKADKYFVSIDGVRSPAHEWVVGRSLTFSSDGSHFAYQTQHDSQMFYVIGAVAAQWQGVEQTGAYLIGPLLFSNDGKRFIYSAQRQKDAKQTLIVDGKDVLSADEVFMIDVQFSSPGDRYACRIREGNKQRYVIDGVLQPAYDSVGGFTFSADGKRYGYFARNGDATSMVIDAKESAKYAAALGIIFSPDGRKYAYVIEPLGPDGKSTKKQQLIYNGGTGEQVFSPFDRIGAIAFSPDGRRLALTGLKGEQWSVAVDGKVTGSYEGIGMIKFSPDSKKLATIAGRGNKQFIVVDTQELPLVDIVGAATFSPDSAQMAFVSRVQNQHWLYLNDQRLGPATFFAFSPDSRFLGHATPGPKEDMWQIAINGEGYGPLFNGFPTGSQLVWASPTQCRIVAGREKEMYLVTVEIGQ